MSLKRIDEIKNTGAKFIIPINFPEVYDVSDPYQANQMELADLRFWNQAQTNPKILAESGIIFALTTDKLKKIDDFRNNLLRAIKYGFDKTKALEALTTIPASLLGKSNEIGSLKNGSLANFLITSGDVFDEKTIFYENWVNGNKFVINDMNIKDIRGDYELTLNNEKFKLKIEGEVASPKSDLKTLADKKVNSKLTLANNWMNLLVRTSDTTKVEFNRLSAFITEANSFSGKATLANGQETYWSAKKTPSTTETKKEEEKKKELNKIFPVTYPNQPFGNLQKPSQKNYFVQKCDRLDERKRRCFARN